MKTMFDLNRIDSQGGAVETSKQESEQAAINALEVRNLNFYYGSFQFFCLGQYCGSFPIPR